MSNALYLIRGLPGSGKTTLAGVIAAATGGELIAADDYFVDADGVYRFDPTKLGEAHALSQKRALQALEQRRTAVVHNTFTATWEMAPYVAMAADTGSYLTVLSVFDGGLTDEQLAVRNTHGVPLVAIATMRARFEHDWRSGDPRAPWER